MTKILFLLYWGMLWTGLFFIHRHAQLKTWLSTEMINLNLNWRDILLIRCCIPTQTFLSGDARCHNFDLRSTWLQLSHTPMNSGLIYSSAKTFSVLAQWSHPQTFSNAGVLCWKLLIRWGTRLKSSHCWCTQFKPSQPPGYSVLNFSTTDNLSSNLLIRWCAQLISSSPLMHSVQTFSTAKALGCKLLNRR